MKSGGRGDGSGGEEGGWWSRGLRGEEAEKELDLQTAVLGEVRGGERRSAGRGTVWDGKKDRTSAD